MLITRPALGFLAFLGFSSGAVALDPSASVRVTPLLQTTTSWNGQPLVYPAGPAEITALQVEVAPGGETGWHQHPVPSFGFVLEGTLEVTLKDGQVKRLNPVLSLHLQRTGIITRATTVPLAPAGPDPAWSAV